MRFFAKLEPHRTQNGSSRRRILACEVQRISMMQISKGSMKVPELIGIVAIVLIFFFVLYMAPSIINDIKTLADISTAETVALDLGGLMTISAASPEHISLSYSSLREDETYNLEISDERVVYVDSPIESVHGNGKLGISIPPDSYEAVSSFTITKSRPDGKNVYEFFAN